MLALADVFIDQVYTFSPILTRIAVALIELILAAIACVASITITCVASDPIYARAMVARVRLTVVDITLAKCPLVTFGGKTHT